MPVVKTKKAKSPDNSSLFETFESMGYKPSEEDVQRLKKAITGIVNVKLKVGIFGQTGMGKSALCNAIFGAEISKVGHGSSVTRKATEAHVELGDGAGIRLFDFPGLGEDEARDEEYKATYREKMPEMDLILWVLSVDDRKNKEDIIAHRDIVRPLADEHKIPVIFVANKADKAHPAGNWDEKKNTPTAEQNKSIEAALNGTIDQEGKRQNGFIGKFNIPKGAICVVSSVKGYGLVGLVETIVRFLPAEKKYGVVREAKKEAVSAQAKQEAKEGLMESIKRAALNVITTHAPEVIAAVGAAAVKWGLKFLKTIF